MTSVFIISAPSGSGKSTLVNRLMAEVRNLTFSVSYTSARMPRVLQRRPHSSPDAWAAPSRIRAVVSALAAMHKGEYAVKSVQAHHAQLARPSKIAAPVR